MSRVYKERKNTKFGVINVEESIRARRQSIRSAFDLPRLGNAPRGRSPTRSFPVKVNAEYRSKLPDRRDHVTSLEEKIKKLARQASEIEDRANKVRERNSRIRSSLDKVEDVHEKGQRILSTESTDVQLTGDRSVEQSEKIEKTDTIASLEESLRQKEKIISEYQLEISELKSVVDQLNETVNNKENEIARLQQQYHSINSQVSQLRENAVHENSHLHEQQSKLECDHQAANCKCEQSIEEMKVLKLKFQNFITELSRLGNMLSGSDKNFEAVPGMTKSSDIARSVMVQVDDPNMKVAMLTNTGQHATPTTNVEANAQSKEEKPPVLPEEPSSSSEEEDPIPDELLCLICKDLMNEAVVIPCCGNSYCDDCLRTSLLESDEHRCPSCHQTDVSPDALIANRSSRQAVDNFKNGTGYTKRSRKQPASHQLQNQQPSLKPLPPINPQAALPVTTVAISNSVDVPVTNVPGHVSVPVSPPNAASVPARASSPEKVNADSSAASVPAPDVLTAAVHLPQFPSKHEEGDIPVSKWSLSLSYCGSSSTGSSYSYYTPRSQFSQSYRQSVSRSPCRCYSSSPAFQRGTGKNRGRSRSGESRKSWSCSSLYGEYHCLSQCPIYTAHSPYKSSTPESENDDEYSVCHTEPSSPFDYREVYAFEREWDEDHFTPECFPLPGTSRDNSRCVWGLIADYRREQLPRRCSLGGANSSAGKYSNRVQLKEKAKSSLVELESSGKTTKASQEKSRENEQDKSALSQPSIKNAEECLPKVESQELNERSTGTEDTKDGLSDRDLWENEKAAIQLDKSTKGSAEKEKQELSLSRGEKDQSRSRLPGSHHRFSRSLCQCLDVANETDAAGFEPAHRESDSKTEAFINNGNGTKEITDEPKMIMAMSAASRNGGTKSHKQSSCGPRGTHSDSPSESQTCSQSSSASSEDTQDSRKKKKKEKKKHKEHLGVDSEPDKTQKHKHKNNMSEKSKDKDTDRKSDQTVQSSVMCKLKKRIRQMSRMFRQTATKLESFANI